MRQSHCFTYILLITFTIVFMNVHCSVNSVNDDVAMNEMYLEIADRFVRTALEDQRGYEWLHELTDIGPRLAGSEQGLQAIRWAETKMNNLGLENVHLQTVMVPHWVRGPVERASIVSSRLFQGKELRVAAIGGTEGTPAQGVTAHVIQVETLEELQALGDEAAGKIVFMNGRLPVGEFSTFTAYFSAYPMRTAGPNTASKLGAVGYILRSLTLSNDNVPHTGNTSYEDSVKRIPAVAVGIQDADFLSEVLRQDPELQIRLQLSAHNLPNAESFNVIGDLRGEQDDQVIVVGGHLDSWDKGTGAHDDGGGCMQALEVVDLYNRLNIRPKKTIRVVLFANEERGHHGGIVFGELAALRDETHVAGIESDNGSFSPRGLTVEQPEAVERLEAFLPYLKAAGIETIELGPSGGDVEHIQNTQALIGLRVDSQRYFNYHHTESDVFEAINPREFELGAAGMAILTYLIGEEW